MEEKITKLKEHCEKQVKFYGKYKDTDSYAKGYYEEHSIVLNIIQQLQAYKDREERLVERVYACHGINEHDLLQILNKEER